MNQILKQYYGYDNFRVGQKEIIEALLNHKKILAIMSTGAGKSICFQIPALMAAGMSIVISPLISLMEDQVRQAQARGIDAYNLHSGKDMSAITKVYQKIQNNECRILYLSPERLLSPSFLNIIKQTNISYIFIDECHVLTTWEEFRPHYNNIAVFYQKYYPDVTLGFFTATLKLNLIEAMLKPFKLSKKKMEVFTFEIKRNNLSFYIIKSKNKKNDLLSLISGLSGMGIIYTKSRADVIDIYTFLAENNFNCTYYHGALDKKLKMDNQKKFMTGECRLIVATNAFGMGIDKDNIRFVIHYHYPASLEDYFQEAGRAGRDGGDAKCYIIFHEMDYKIHYFFLENIENRKNFKKKKEELLMMNKYLKTKLCLAGFISVYLNNAYYCCKKCQNCKKKYFFKNNVV